VLIKVMDAPVPYEGLSIAVATSRFNETITKVMQEACLARLAQNGVKETTIVQVSGALELPFILQALAQKKNYHALIALGAVIRGETYHFEVVANESARGLMQLQLALQIPVANGVLTVDNEGQAFARAVQKARDCADVAVEMASLLQTL